MSLRSDPLDRLSIPDGTTVEEHDLVADGDVVIGGQSTVEFGVRGRNVIAGERVTFGGDIEAGEDCRLDMWCDVDGNVLVGQDAYLGERVHIAGQLMVSGDLDIGDDVDIEEGFEANGWIVIRNPMPTIVFLFVYLSQLLRIGEEEAAQDIVEELLADDREHEPVLVPRSARVSDDAWRVSTPATIGDDCRLHGNIRAASLAVGSDTEIFGSLRAREDVTVGPGTVIHGDVSTRDGTVRIAPDAHVRGDVSCEDLELDDEADVDGAIRARGEMSIVRGDRSAREAADESAADADADPDDPDDWEFAGDVPDPGEGTDDPGVTEADDRPSDAPEPAIVRVDAGEEGAEEPAGGEPDADEPVPAIVEVPPEPEPAIVRVDEPDADDEGAAETGGPTGEEGAGDGSSAGADPATSGDETPSADQDGLAGVIAEAEER